MSHSSMGAHRNHPAPGRASNPESPVSRFRSHAGLALGSGVPVSAPVLMLTGSLALCALVVVLTVVCVGLATLMI